MNAAFKYSFDNFSVYFFQNFPKREWQRAMAPKYVTDPYENYTYILSSRAAAQNLFLLVDVNLEHFPRFTIRLQHLKDKCTNTTLLQ